MRFVGAWAGLLGLVSVSAVAASPLSDCESKNPLTEQQGCTAVLAAGQEMQSLDFGAYNNRAQALLSLGQPQEALKDALAGEALNPENGPIHLAAAKAYVALNQMDKAKAAVQQAQRLSPNDPDTYVLQGEMQLAAGHVQAGFTSLKRALALDPNDADAYVARAVAYMQNGKLQLAVFDVSKAVSLGSTDPRVHLVLGFAAADKNNWQEAALEETQYLAAAPENPLVLAALAQAQHALGHNQAALVAINKALTFTSSVPEFYLLRAQVEDALTQFSDEIADLTTVIENSSGDKDQLYRTLLWRANAEQEAKLPDAALEDVNAAIKLQPHGAKAYAAKAVLERLAGHAQLAIADDNEAITRDKTDIQAYEDQADAYSLLHNYEAAAEDETAVLKLQPNSALDLNNRCWFLALDGKLPEAEVDCLHALRLSPNDPSTLDSTGYVYLQLKQYQKAIEFTTRALAQSPHLATSLYGRALAEQALGQDKKAEADRALAKRYDPKIEQDFGH